MPKRQSTESDPVEFAKGVFDQLIAKYDPDSLPPAVAPAEPPAEPGKNPAAVALGKLGGRKGGLTRAANLSPKKRSQLARQAARARWANKQKGK